MPIDQLIQDSSNSMHCKHVICYCADWPATFGFHFICDVSIFCSSIVAAILKQLHQCHVTKRTFVEIRKVL